MYVLRKKIFTNEETKDIIVLNEETKYKNSPAVSFIRYSFVEIPQNKLQSFLHTTERGVFV